MQRFRDIAEGQGGVSILYGIMFLLVATMVAGVILSAAVSSVQRVHAEQERNQNALTLRSAGDLVRDCILGTSCKITISVDKATNKPTVEAVETAGPLESVLNDAMVKASGARPPLHNAEDYSGSFDVEVKGSESEALNKSKVRVDFTLHKAQEVDAEGVDKSYMIDATATLENGSQRLFLVAVQSVSSDSEPVSESDDVKIYETTVKWDTVELSTAASKGGDGS